jgi:hypothetical protein
MRVARLAMTIAWTALSVLLAALPACAESRVALVIGMSNYKFATRLENPGNDARLMADTLRKLGFTLIGDGAQLDLDRGEFARVLQLFGSRARDADVAVFYYAGHGIQLKGENYLAPVDANPTAEADALLQMISASLVLRQMDQSRASLNVMILDACRQNPFPKLQSRRPIVGLAQMSAPERSIISFAAQPNTVALEGRDRNSPYTKVLAQMIQVPGHDIFTAFNDVGLAVMEATRNTQQPWLAAAPIKGIFQFAPRVGSTASPEAETASPKAEAASPKAEAASPKAEAACPDIVGKWKWSAWLLGPTEAAFYSDGSGRHSSGNIGTWTCDGAKVTIVWTSGRTDVGTVSEDENSLEITNSLGTQFTARRRR